MLLTEIAISKVYNYLTTKEFLTWGFQQKAPLPICLVTLHKRNWRVIYRGVPSWSTESNT